MRNAWSEPVFYAGFGCRKGCPVETLEQLLRTTLVTHRLCADHLVGLASIDLKFDEPGLQALAERLGIPWWCSRPPSYSPSNRSSAIAHPLPTPTAAAGASLKAQPWHWPHDRSAPRACW